MFYKDYLPITRRNDLCVLSECIANLFFLLAATDLRAKLKIKLRSIV